MSKENRNGLVWDKASGDYVSKKDLHLKKVLQKTRWKKKKHARKCRNRSGRR